MEIKTITRYKFDSKEYNSLSEIKTDIENRIGKIIDYSDVTLSPKQRLNIFNAIIENKAEINRLLTITFTTEGEEYQDKNILDL